MRMFILALVALVSLGGCATPEQTQSAVANFKELPSFGDRLDWDRDLEGRQYKAKYAVLAISGVYSGDIFVTFSSFYAPYNVVFYVPSEGFTWSGIGTRNDDGCITVVAGTFRTDTLCLKNGKLAGTYEATNQNGSFVRGNTEYSSYRQVDFCEPITDPWIFKGKILKGRWTLHHWTTKVQMSGDISVEFYDNGTDPFFIFKPLEPNGRPYAPWTAKITLEKGSIVAPMLYRTDRTDTLKLCHGGKELRGWWVRDGRLWGSTVFPLTD